MKTYRSFVFAGVLLLADAAAMAQDGFPRVETAPAFMYIHTGELFGGSKALNCAGAGGTIAVNVSSVLGLAADLGGCKLIGVNNTYGIASRATGSEYTFLFGPRLTFNRRGKVHPFFDLNFGGVRAAVNCNNGNLGNACGGLSIAPPIVVHNPTASSVSKVAFGLTVGGGLDVQLNKKVALRLVQAEYLYTRFGNDCEFAVCSNNNSQNSLRLKSGFVFSWGGNRTEAKVIPPAPPPPPPPPVAMKNCPGGESIPVNQDCAKLNIRLSLQANPTAVCPGVVTRISAAGLPAGAATQWSVNGQPAGQSGSLDFGPGRAAGSYAIALRATAEGYNDAAAQTTVIVNQYTPPSGSVTVSSPEVFAGDKVTVSANFIPGQCGGALGAAVFSTTEGSVSGNQFDSTGVRFDPASATEQRKTITITARAADQGGAGTAQATVVVKQRAVAAAKRYPDVVFPAGSARINNCGKRVLLEELKNSLDSDPNGVVVFVGHTSTKETSASGLDVKRALNAAAVISAGAGICLGYSAANILVTGAGTADNGVDFQPRFCEASTGERSGNAVQQSEDEAKNRRLEVWFVPPGGIAPQSAQGAKDALGLSVQTLGCPR